MTNEHLVDHPAGAADVGGPDDDGRVDLPPDHGHHRQGDVGTLQGWKPFNPLVPRAQKIKIRQFDFEATFKGLICNGNGLLVKVKTQKTHLWNATETNAGTYS